MYNIASVDWLVRAVGANLALKKLKKFQPRDMLSYTDETANVFQRKYDIYSDSFTKKVSPDQLKSIFNAMDVKVQQQKILKPASHRYENVINFLLVFSSSKDLENLNRSDMHQLEVELAGDQVKPANMFRLATALFYKSSEKCAKRMDLSEQLFKFRGGKVRDGMDPQLSHIFVDRNAFVVDEFLEEYNASKDAIRKIRVVSFEWIIQSFNSGKKCNAKSFQISI